MLNLTDEEFQEYIHLKDKAINHGLNRKEIERFHELLGIEFNLSMLKKNYDFTYCNRKES